MKDIKIVGMDFDEFKNALASEDEDKFKIFAKPARLIPIGKDDEMAMTSVFLSALILVKEYRDIISEKIDLLKKGSLYCFTEVSFPTVISPDTDKEKSRFDGLAIVVGGNKIKDACIFEMKHGNSKIDGNQIEKYAKMAMQLGIKKIVSVSNQCVTNPTDYPVPVKLDKKWKGQLYHLSWSYIVYFADILLQKNGTDISDVDQQNIMFEVKEYLNNCGGKEDFGSMKIEKWGDVVRDLASDITNKMYEENRKEIVKSWIQEEKDLS